jgi:hypothetical protein
MSKIYITNGITQDGFGARMHRAINTMAFTFYLRDTYNLDIEYIHTPFYYEGFGETYDALESVRREACNHSHGDPYNEITREGYMNRARLWDENMGYRGEVINDLDLDNYSIIDSQTIGITSTINHLLNNKDNRLYVIKYLQSEYNNGDFDINMVNDYLPEIKSRFIIKESDNNKIILHIRRKDAIFHGESRYLDDDYYLDILKELNPFKSEYNIIVSTQRSNFNYEKYSDWKVVYDDQEEDYELFKEMTSAKVLVVGKSSLSIAAAFLNPNTVVYPAQLTRGLNRYIDKDTFIKKIKNRDGF